MLGGALSMVGLTTTTTSTSSPTVSSISMSSSNNKISQDSNTIEK